MKVRFFAHLQAVTGTAEYDLPAACSLREDELWTRLESTFPGLSQWRESTRIACNLSYAGPRAEFHDTDEIALIPPVSGG